MRNKYTTTKAIDIVATRVILPLSEDDVEVAMVIMAQTFEYGAELVVRLGDDATLAPYFGWILRKKEPLIAVTRQQGDQSQSFR